MKNILVIALLCTFAAVAQAQTIMYVDSSLTTPAQAYAYKIEAAPTIDGNGSEWENIPWTQAYFNDRDRNNDALMDPFVDKNDLVAKFKAGWVSGGHTLYMLVSFSDNKWYPLSKNPTSDVYNCDGFELRLDPLNVKAAGETGDNSVHYIILEYGNNTLISSGGYTSATNYVAAWTADTLSYPKQVTLELELTLQSSIALSAEYVMGFYPYFNDNDGFVGKTTAAVLWPQMWSAMDGTRTGVDQAWEHTWRWGELKCVEQTIRNVSGGSGLQTALDAAVEGDIVKVGAGTYTGTFTIATPGVSLLGAGSDVTILTPANDALPVLDIMPGAYNVTVDGFKVQGNLSGESPVSVGGIKIEAGEAKILNNSFVDLNDKAIECVNNEGANIIDGNMFHNIANTAIVITDVPFTAVRNNLIEKGGTKISAKVTKDARSSPIDIAYNTIRDFVSGSVGISYGVAGSTVASRYTWTIHHNYIYVTQPQRATGSHDFGDNAIENQESNLSGSVTYMYNNTWAFQKNCAVQMNGPGTNKFYLKNNISAWNSRQREKAMTDYDIRNRPAATDTPKVTIDHSLSIIDIPTMVYIVGSAPYNDPAMANVIADPAFADTLTDVLSLTAASPAIDAGAVDPFGFKFAFAGTAPDMGAFEYGMPTETGVNDPKGEKVLRDFELSQNYPNPFNPSTTISYSISQSVLVKVEVSNLLGQRVATLVNTHKPAGSYTVSFDASQLPSGVYFYTLTAGHFASTKKMLLMR